MNIAFSACDSEVKLWDAGTCVATVAHERPRCSLNRCCYNRSGELLACAFSDGAVSVLSIKSGVPSSAPLFHLTQPGDNVTSLAFNQTGDTLYATAPFLHYIIVTFGQVHWQRARQGRSVEHRAAQHSAPLRPLLLPPR